MEITEKSAQSYLDQLSDPRKTDILKLVDLFSDITALQPQMWGSIIGFGNLRYEYKSGHSGNMPLIGLANRKQAITLYLSFTIRDCPELKNLGKFTTGKSCLYIKKLADINLNVLEAITHKAIAEALTYDFIQPA